MMNEQEWQWASRLRANWDRWHDLNRADGVVALRGYGWSYRKLGTLVGHSEGIIRYIEIVSQFPTQWKQWLIEKRYSTRRLMAEWRKQTRPQSE